MTKPKASFVVYVDESGDEGFAFKGSRTGSSHWFVLSAVVTRKPWDLETVKLVDELRQHLNYTPRKPMHFRKMKHEHRLPYVQYIAAGRIRTVTVLVHKPSIAEPEKFAKRNRLYYYTTRLLLERVSWFCRDHRIVGDPGDGSAEIIFSNRSGTSYPEMKTYFNLLRQQSGFAGVRIEWDVIKTDQVRAINHDSSMGLQIADAVASSFYYAVQVNPYGFNEPRYAQMLKRVVLRPRTVCAIFRVERFHGDSRNEPFRMRNQRRFGFRNRHDGGRIQKPESPQGSVNRPLRLRSRFMAGGLLLWP